LPNIVFDFQSGDGWVEGNYFMLDFLR